MDNTHNYKDTIREAAETEDSHEQASASSARERKQDAEAAYEALALTCSMGMLGMEEEQANLLQLELAQELLYKFDPPERENNKPQTSDKR